MRHREQIEQRVRRALDLEKLSVRDTPERADDASEGLATIAGSGSAGRRPGRNSRVKTIMQAF